MDPMSEVLSIIFLDIGGREKDFHSNGYGNNKAIIFKECSFATLIT